MQEKYSSCYEIPELKVGKPATTGVCSTGGAAVHADFGIHNKIESIRKKLGGRLLILAHHYMAEDVFVHGDMCGDSFQLSAQAAQNETAEAIVFCGVHFMAESADILANQPMNRKNRGGLKIPVMLPDLEAGCPMAEMTTLANLTDAWQQLSKIIDVSDITPVTYVNSSAAVKAFCGRNGGVACTSSNAASVLRWALNKRSRVLFVPDQHLGRNTSLAIGIPESEISLLQNADKSSRVILWDGFCCVHQQFTKSHIEKVREQYSGISVIVHPECPREIVSLADDSGSTSYIIKKVEESAANAKWAIGTEWNLVERLSRRFPEKTIVSLSPAPSRCETMGKITAASLLTTLENYANGNPTNVVSVSDAEAKDALLCLNRMLKLP